MVTTYSYDLVSRLASQKLDFPVGWTNDLTIGSMAYNPASQLTSVNRSNDAYAWTASGSGSTAYVPNGLNQYTSIGGAAPTYDSNGNMKTEPQSGKNYTYTSENLLRGVSGGGVPAATLTYDPLMRLYEDQANTSGAATQFVYDGTDMIAEYDQANALQKRTVFGAGVDEPLVQLDAAGNRTWLSADERGSIIALSDDSGNVSAKNAYDEYGKPQPGNTGRFQYTGQAWIDDLGTSPASGQGLYYYKSRMYAPHVGRFMQPDPIGYVGDGLNLYAYVLNDPVNKLDPAGLQECGPGEISGTPTGSHISQCYDPQFSNLGIGYAPASGTFWANKLGVGGIASGYWSCVRRCNNPPSGYYDSTGSIVVYAPPAFGWTPFGRDINSGSGFGYRSGWTVVSTSGP